MSWDTGSTGSDLQNAWATKRSTMGFESRSRASSGGAVGCRDRSLIAVCPALFTSYPGSPADAVPALKTVDGGSGDGP
jgi:hypothetical protein